MPESALHFLGQLTQLHVPSQESGQRLHVSEEPPKLLTQETEQDGNSTNVTTLVTGAEEGVDTESHEDSNKRTDAVPNLNLPRVFGSQGEGRSHEMSAEGVKQEDRSSNEQGTTTPKVRVIL